LQRLFTPPSEVFPRGCHLQDRLALFWRACATRKLSRACRLWPSILPRPRLPSTEFRNCARRVWRVQRKKEIGCARSDKGQRPPAPRSRSHESAQNLRKESDALLALLGEVITAYVVAVEYFVDEIAALRRRIFFSN